MSPAFALFAFVQWNDTVKPTINALRFLALYLHAYPLQRHRELSSFLIKARREDLTCAVRSLLRFVLVF